VSQATYIAPKTFTPKTGENSVIAPKRKLRAVRAEELFNVIGAGIAALTTTALLFGWFTPMSGSVGFIFVSYVFFILFYATLTSLTGTKEEIKDNIVTVLLYSAGAILIGALMFVVVFTLIKGQVALPYLNFFTQDMRVTGPIDPLTSGGILHAIVGTLIQISIALAITIPLGITTAVFLNEVGGKFARFVRTISDAMTALPSIVAGLFIFSALIRGIPGIIDPVMQKSGLAAAFAISVMMLPIIIRASDVVLRLVPGNLREASYALGATRWKTVWSIVLPTSRSGLVTAVILGTARGIGETSPVLLTSGMTNNMNFDPTQNPMISLPLQVFTFIKSPEPNFVARGFGTAAVLMFLVLILFMMARLLGGKGPGVLSDRQRRRALAQSQMDLYRISMREQKANKALLNTKSNPKPERQK
jgi:phosphate transport system permease protein